MSMNINLWSTLPTGQERAVLLNELEFPRLGLPAELTSRNDVMCLDLRSAEPAKSTIKMKGEEARRETKDSTEARVSTKDSTEARVSTKDSTEVRVSTKKQDDQLMVEKDVMTTHQYSMESKGGVKDDVEKDNETRGEQ
ncbi:hypothetical protein BDY19DRAFT_991477 [Irpex rosettiformis]|uniref:Uncharacterized protein n=1 Tax=Irpex rosettiformis TaxID=378272 RepID=A0ACB8UC05_9APHY|nr:hypothetical protein BDY19DRAFT_991477 [Irpex rosettiformis]